jgi:hypothetical protein
LHDVSFLVPNLMTKLNQKWRIQNNPAIDSVAADSEPDICGRIQKSGTGSDETFGKVICGSGQLASGICITIKASPMPRLLKFIPGIRPYLINKKYPHPVSKCCILSFYLPSVLYVFSTVLQEEILKNGYTVTCY